ncbi:hypothetical protein GMRT_10070 [Giardia muris]|uniref:Uncharacterized protein n=1 Tax=Giardia muris TaxID=5742 RepID=A0A4Z1T671_GIAMU|nr:hypothetical protein GMRT_10070 [Giardia muris]|eukprot:TNJ27961.1 hypothetical protein GMRT_10070 [Giardia muris]
MRRLPRVIADDSPFARATDTRGALTTISVPSNTPMVGKQGSRPGSRGGLERRLYASLVDEENIQSILVSTRNVPVALPTIHPQLPDDQPISSASLLHTSFESPKTPESTSSMPRPLMNDEEVDIAPSPASNAREYTVRKASAIRIPRQESGPTSSCAFGSHEHRAMSNSRMQISDTASILLDHLGRLSESQSVSTSVLGQKRALSKPSNRCIPAYLRTPIEPPIYRTHGGSKGGKRVQTNATKEDAQREAPGQCEKRILITTCSPFRRVRQTPYGDIIHLQESVSFGVTRYSTLSRLRWITEVIVGADYGSNPRQKLLPTTPLVYLEEEAPADILHPVVIRSSRKAFLEMTEVKNLLRHDILEKGNANVVAEAFQPIQPFDPLLFWNESFVMHVDHLGSQYGFGVQRCPTPLASYFEDVESTIRASKDAIVEIRRATVLILQSSWPKEKRTRAEDLLYSRLLQDLYRIDLFNPRLVTEADTYSICDKECKIKQSARLGYLRLDPLTGGSPLPEGAVSVAQLMRRGISIYSAEQEPETSNYRISQRSSSETRSY